jgi:hypothetical protein
MDLISVVAYHDINYADTNIADGVFRDVVHGLFQGARFFQHVIRLRGTRRNAILFASITKA